MLRTILSRAVKGGLRLAIAGAGAVAYGASLALTVTTENAKAAPKRDAFAPLPADAIALGRGVVAPGTPQSDRENLALLFHNRGALYVYTQDDKNYAWSVGLKLMRSIMGESKRDLQNPIGYFAIERDRESHVTVHHIHNNGVRTGADIPAARRVAMLAAFGLPTGEAESTESEGVNG